jgi:DNA-binding GntR family transcriptional regulator
MREGAMEKERGAEPRYRQVAEELRAAILSGALAEGAQVPTESSLCAHYAISRFTAREALRRLQGEGLIRRRRGSGTVVAAASAGLRQPLSDVADLLQYAADSEFSFEPRGRTVLSAARAEQMGLRGPSEWIGLWGTRRRAASGAILAVTEVLINPALEAHVAGLEPGRRTLFAQLAAAGGFRVARIVQNISAIPAGEEEARALGVARRSAILRISRVYWDENDRVVEISISYHPGDRFTYMMHIDP